MASPSTSVAPVTLVITHPNEPLTLNDVDQRDLTLRQVMDFIDGTLVGAKGAVGTTFALSYGSARASGTVTLASAAGVAASGTVTLSSAVGVAASGTVTLGGGAGNVTVVINGTTIGPVTFNTSDNQTAADVRDAINANSTVAALVTATATTNVITITADTKGTAGNAITLTSSRSAGTAVASGATLANGAQAVTVAVGGTTVSVATEGIDDTATAVLVRNALNANSTIAALTTATAALGVITITADTKGTAGNSITLTSSAGGGTATASGATLEDGEQAVTVTVDGNEVSIATEGADDTATAALIAAALAADSSVAALVTVTQAAKVVTLTAKEFGTAGNSITLVSDAGSGTATASGATLADGAASSTKTYTR